MEVRKRFVRSPSYADRQQWKETTEAIKVVYGGRLLFRDRRARLRSEHVKANMSQEPSNHVFMDQHGKHM